MPTRQISAEYHEAKAFITLEDCADYGSRFERSHKWIEAEPVYDGVGRFWVLRALNNSTGAVLGWVKP